MSERILYHQIHPVKVATDVSAALGALVLFWRHRLLAGVVVSIIPPVVSSAFLISYADLTPYQRSAAGQYLKRSMMGWVQSLRFVGFAVMLLGAWKHARDVVAGGIALIAFGWFHGLLPMGRR
ncbi:MAG: hypothetical protein M3Z66_07755 [Chloroflexota bacterium]|nr:hypothetical protein [Chloroflexota bacterium]